MEVGLGLASLGEAKVDGFHRVVVEAGRIVATLPPRTSCPSEGILGDGVDGVGRESPVSVVFVLVRRDAHSVVW
ncbi:MAG: hypothetical protein EBU83_02180 [bacterium]|nr:hypothetical protein [Candidatus Aquidulcis sp.]